MKKIGSILFWLLGGIVLAGAIVIAWAWKPYHLTAADVNACTVDAECVVVGEGVCSRPTSINRAHQQLWELHQRLIKIPPNPIMCAPNLPYDYYQPQCLQNACRAALIKEGY